MLRVGQIQDKIYCVLRFTCHSRSKPCDNDMKPLAFHNIIVRTVFDFHLLYKEYWCGRIPNTHHAHQPQLNIKVSKIFNPTIVLVRLGNIFGYFNLINFGRGLRGLFFRHHRSQLQFQRATSNKTTVETNKSNALNIQV